MSHPAVVNAPNSLADAYRMSLHHPMSRILIFTLILIYEGLFQQLRASPRPTLSAYKIQPEVEILNKTQYSYRCKT
jgi:hypothetical protein